ncbi:TadE/TadG family type IV pilus assembly protein [Novosphingobium sp.]|uniref:TadE/TadG family type IV pilus assembly protein n=1 Tax=Novosphingobium sp. TaxID=1874826 RepID=UPI00261E2334|nr:TadE/TadG family type IV pilus assembly protein [Novosphingobium sp.]
MTAAAPATPAGSARPSRLDRWRRLLGRLRRDRRAISAVEFAMVMPVLSGAGLGTIELANMATTYMRVSQAAVMMADNASRAKQASGSGGAVMREFDVNDLFAAIDLQYPGLQMYTNGRVILSSLEQNNAGGQWIHWQRCRGLTTWASKYGVQGTGTATGTSFAGMGPSGSLLTADSNSAIMFVEVYYQYRPIFFNVGGAAAPLIYRSAAVYVRDDRDLTGGSPYPGAGLANPSPTSSRSTC